MRVVSPGIGEVRRLWLDPGWRRRGVARPLMAALEDASRGHRSADLCLSTGDRQPEAVAFYVSTGWGQVLVGQDGRQVLPLHFVS